MAHRTARHGSTGAPGEGPWLTSTVMWWNCMRFVDEGGVRVRDLVTLARTKTNFKGMARWGYIVIKPDPADKVVRATQKGQRAKEVCGPLILAIEERWRKRFGKQAIDELRKSLSTVVDQIPYELPDCMPILGYGLFSKARAKVETKPGVSADLPLPALLSRVLLAFTLQFERESKVSLAICANVLRVLDETGVPVRDLPVLTGVSKEAISMAMGYLQKRGLAVVAAEPDKGPAKISGLTTEGLEAKDAYQRLLRTIEERWCNRFGKDKIAALRNALERLAGNLFQGLEPYPDGWRASVRRPETLPHFPMVLHRGGYPDGS